MWLGLRTPAARVHLTHLYLSWGFITINTVQLLLVGYLAPNTSWTAKRSNHSILKEINPEYSLEVLMLKLELQYFGHLMWRANSLEKTLMLGKTEGKRRKGWQRMRWLNNITDSMHMKLNKLNQLSNWTTTLWNSLILTPFVIVAAVIVVYGKIYIIYRFNSSVH